MLIGAILKRKSAIEHVVGGDRGKEQTDSFHLDIEIGVRVVVYPNSTSRLGSWWAAKCCLIDTVNSTLSDLWRLISLPCRFAEVLTMSRTTSRKRVSGISGGRISNVDQHVLHSSLASHQ